MSKAKPKLTEAESHSLYLELVLESDRGCVLAAHGHLDGILEKVLREEFRPRDAERDTGHWLDWLFKSGGQPPLQSFYVKLVTARALGMVDRGPFESLDELNRLRRHFAHYPGRVTLTESRVAAIYDPLAQPLKKLVNGFEQIASIVDQSPARARFISTVSVLILELDLAEKVATYHDGTRRIDYRLDMETMLKTVDFSQLKAFVAEQKGNQSGLKRQ
jgi:hypothetical protein